jgi:tetratricopeptide (TPR) repeat protein
MTVERVRRLRLSGDHGGARELALRLLRSEPDDGAIALLRNELGLLLKATGHYRAARAQYERGLQRAWANSGDARGAESEGAGPVDRDEAATLLHNLAGIRFVLGDPAGAVRCGLRGLAMRRRLWGDDDLAALLDEGNIAPILAALGQLDTAEIMLYRLLREFTARHEEAEVAATLANLGAVAGYREDWVTAHDLLARAVTLKERHYGKDSPELEITRANLAVAAAKMPLELLPQW